MLLDIALFGLAFLFAIPAITGYFAYSHGRSFWLWFVLGCFFPFISNIILAVLCWKAARKEERRRVGVMTRYEASYMQSEITEVMQPQPKTQDNPS
ncbi:MAG: hypothetical protein AAGE93_21685 [Bacteroidota bacterium]